MKKVALLFLFSILFTTAVYAEKGDWVKVIRIVDENTVKVIYSSGELKEVKMTGLIFPPEEKNKILKKEVIQNLEKDLMNQRVRLTYEKSEDIRKDKISAYIWLNGKRYNDIMLEKGYAIFDKNTSTIYKKEFESAELRGQEHKVGLWAKADIIGEQKNEINTERTNTSENLAPWQTDFSAFIDELTKLALNHKGDKPLDVNKFISKEVDYNSSIKLYHYGRKSHTKEKEHQGRPYNYYYLGSSKYKLLFPILKLYRTGGLKQGNKIRLSAEIPDNPPRTSNDLRGFYIATTSSDGIT